MSLVANRRMLALTAALGIAGLAIAPGAFAQTINVTSACKLMTSTTTFTADHATAGPCPSGTTLVGGGARLTLSGADVPNNGGAIMGPMPASDSLGTPSNNGDTNPTFWAAYASYAGQAPGTDTVTSYAMCSSSPPAPASRAPWRWVSWSRRPPTFPRRPTRR